MSFTKVTRYRCDECGELYVDEPEHCHKCLSEAKAGRRSKYVAGMIVGAFRLIRRAEKARSWYCQCRACGETCIVGTNNLKTQKSCGCLNHSSVSVTTATDEMIRYHCGKCGMRWSGEKEGSCPLCQG